MKSILPVLAFLALASTSLLAQSMNPLRTLNPQEREEYLKVRASVIQGSPELKKEYLDTQEKLNAAMIKENASIAPIVANVMSHEQDGGINMSPLLSLPRSQKQDYLKVRVETLQSNPELENEVKALQEKLDAAMIKQVPSTASIVARVKAAR